MYLYTGKLTEEDIERYGNGCGTEGWKGSLVPNHLWFLSIKRACNIHDAGYELAEPNIKAKETEDRIFRNNMLRIINAKTKWKWLKRRRYRAARVYYRFVVELGGPAFWEGKNPKLTIS